MANPPGNRPTLIPLLAFLLIFPLLLSLGIWQLNRAAEKKQMILDREARVSLAALNLNRTDRLGESDRYRPARATGEFDTERQWLIDNRVLNGRPGYHVYSLVRLRDDGRWLLVNRGWVALGPDRAELPDLPLPGGEVVLTGRLDRTASVGWRMGEADLTIGPLQTVQTFEIEELASALGRELLPLLLVLDEGQPGTLTRDWTPSEAISPQKHVGYAVQWFALALALVIIVLGILLRRRGRSREMMADKHE
jgi:surfeit locus 1 family protein